jgi:hypothetical protein
MKRRGINAWAAGALGFAILGLASIPAAAQAKGGQGKDEKKPGVSAEILQKYDRNGNGKLDPDEEAAMRAEEARLKRQKEKKK